MFVKKGELFWRARLLDLGIERERERERERSQTLFRVLSKLGNFANLGLGLSFGRREKKGILIWWWGGVHLLVVTC